LPTFQKPNYERRKKASIKWLDGTEWGRRHFDERGIETKPRRSGRDAAIDSWPCGGPQRVSVITVQRAYESREREGLIHSRIGKGFFISELHDHEKKDIASVSLAKNISPYIAAAISEGLRPQEGKAVVEQVLKQNIAKQGVTR